jgi:DNA-directed RNA polymerase specialized sigma24 family protein
MWPDDFIDWAIRQRPRALNLVNLGLLGPLGATRLSAESSRLAELALRHALDVANDRRRFPSYFLNEQEFGLWLVVTGLREGYRLLLRHRGVENELRRLPAEQCRLLVMTFLEQLPDGDLASLLRVLQVNVPSLRQQALNALLALLH